MLRLKNTRILGPFKLNTFTIIMVQQTSPKVEYPKQIKWLVWNTSIHERTCATDGEQTEPTTKSYTLFAPRFNIGWFFPVREKLERVEMFVKGNPCVDR